MDEGPSPWQKLNDDTTGVPYYYNSETGESTYEVPPDLEWETHEARDRSPNWINNIHYY